MIRLDQVIKNFEECIQALLDKLESRILGTILGLLWWCFVLFRTLLGFTWVFVLRQPHPSDRSQPSPAKKRRTSVPQHAVNLADEEDDDGDPDFHFSEEKDEDDEEAG